MPKCRGCAAEIESQTETCPFCGTQNPFAAPAPGSAEEPVPTAAPTPVEEEQLHNKGTGASGFGREMKTFSCNSCGARVSYDPGLKTLACAYCGSTYVIEREEKDDTERPSRIVPFAFLRDKAEEMFWQWLGKGFFRPRDLTKKSTINEIRGVYMPFWAFDADADSSWTADAGYNYTVQESYTAKDEKGNTVTKYRNVTKTRWEPANGTHFERYDDWLVSASKGLDQELVSKIVPFHLDQAKPYSGEYLAGFAAENPSIAAVQAQGTARQELEQEETGTCADMVPGDKYRNLKVVTRFREWAYDLAMLPLWISAYRYKDKVYRFLVNGQTGEVQGKAPFSWLKLVLVILIGLGIVGAGATLWLLFGQK